MPKKIGKGVPEVVGVRLAREDVARLEALAEALPWLGRSGVARQAILRGLELFEAAAAEKDETKRLTGLARLCGMGAPAKPPRGGGPG